MITSFTSAFCAVFGFVFGLLGALLALLVIASLAFIVLIWITDHLN